MRYARRLARFLLTHLVWGPVDRICECSICVTLPEFLNQPGQRFVCIGCDRSVPWCYGAADDMPLHCDDCWALNDEHPIKGATP